MKKISLLINFVLALGHSALWCMNFSNFNLQEAWEAEIIKPINKNDANLLKGKHVLFIAGLLGYELADIMGNYYLDNIKAVEKDLGGTSSYYSPLSSRSIPENADILYSLVMSTAREQKKPIDLVGHSKGAAEILYMILMHPELIIDGIVDHVLLIQAAIGGSPLAETKEGFLFNIAMSLFSPNLETLTAKISQQNFKNAFQNFESALKTYTGYINYSQKISSKIFYVQSKTTSDYSLAISILLTVMQNNLDDYEGEHDGLLPLSSQYHPDIGVPLGVLNADHADLTVSRLSNVSNKARRALTRLLFRLMAQAGQ